MKTGIKTRLISSYLLVIILTVVLFEAIILSALRFYYIEGVKQSLREQSTLFLSYYEQDIPAADMKDKAAIWLQNYPFTVRAQVQLIDLNGDVVGDTHGDAGDSLAKMEDVQQALAGKNEFLASTIQEEAVFTVSQPIIVDGSIVGAIRLTTSMEQVNDVFHKNMRGLIGIGIVVVLIAAAVSYLMANTITKPVQIMTTAAEQMASGKFSTRVAKEKDDELGKLADTLNYMAEEVEKHEQLKNEFIASVSHELRTPLTSVKGWAVTLHSMAEDEIFQEGLEIISNESDRLTHLVEDLLDFSSLSAGKVVYNMEKINLQQVLRQVVSQLRPRAERQHVFFQEKYEAGAMITGDADRLKQVIINVVDNALKFTPADGTIAINFSVIDKHAVVVIRDTGSGISAEELALVKGKFYKGKGKGAGSGLGLAICQEIVEAHQGKFDITSVVGEGTTVEVWLPLHV